MIPKIKKTIQIIDTINEWVGSIVKYGLLLMAGSLMIEVVGRYIFNSPTIWVWDVCKQIICILGALGGGYALLYGQHVKVDVLWGGWSPKKRAVVDIATSVLFFVFMIALLYEGTGMAKDSWILKERATTVLAPPLYYIKTALPVGAALLFLQGISKLVKDVLTLITGEEQESKSMDFS